MSIYEKYKSLRDEGPSRFKDVDTIIHFYNDCLEYDCKPTYLSAPVTTDVKFSGKSRSDVIKDNIKNANSTYETIRKEYYIDQCVKPWMMCQKHWSNEQCMWLWVNVIKRCEQMYMLPNWARSAGCIEEFLYAQQLKMPVYDHENILLKLNDGIAKIKREYNLRVKKVGKWEVIENLIAQLEGLV